MDVNYSIWALSQTEATPRQTYQHPFGELYGFNYLPHDFPVREAETFGDQNSELLHKIADDSPLDAIQVWLGAVSARMFPGDNEAVMKAKTSLGEEWNDSYRLDWDLITLFHFYGLTRNQAEDMGSYNYAVTGYELFMGLFTGLGIREDMADHLTRPLIRGGGAAYQVAADLALSRFLRVEHTWYGEEVKDASRVEAGMDYAKFKRFAMIAKESGVELDARDFGFRDHAKLVLDLSDYDLSEKIQEKEFLKKMEESLKRFRKDMERKQQEDKRTTLKLG